MRLEDLVDPRLVFTDLEGQTLEEVLTEMAECLEKAQVVRDAPDLARRLLERERLGCTGLGGGIAIPHCKLKDLQDVLLSVGISERGVDFHAPDGERVTLIFLILSPAQAAAQHLQALARISRLLRTPGLAASLRQAGSAEEIVGTLREAEGRLPIPV
jgi:PTS system nitrogen regulatory IIA component